MPPPLKYNVALLAVGHPEAYMEVAHHHFSARAQGYLLGANSLPHITICQFVAERSSLPLLIRDLEGAESPLCTSRKSLFEKAKRQAIGSSPRYKANSLTLALLLSQEAPSVAACP